MKINWKVRLKNPLFYVALIGAILLPILQYYQMGYSDLTTWEGLFTLLKTAASNPFVVGTVIYTLIMFFIDPTTKGFSDSNQALTYKQPRKDGDVK